MEHESIISLLTQKDKEQRMTTQVAVNAVSFERQSSTADEMCKETQSQDDCNNPTTYERKEAPTIRQQSPLIDATWMKHFLFGWAWPLLELGSTRSLDERDLPEVHPTDSSEYNRTRITKLWENSNSNSNSPHGLACALLKDYFLTTKLAQLILAINSASRIGQAIALGFLMEQFVEDNSRNTNTKEGYIWAFVLVVCGLVAFPTKQHLYFRMYRKGLQLRVGLVAVLYDKALKLSSNGGGVSAGKLTNLASNDVERFLIASIPSLHFLVGPIEAIVILIVGIYTIGPVFAVGHAVFLVLVPLQIFLSRKFVHFRSQVASLTDARVTLVSQAVSNNRIVKMNAWELEFEKRIAKLRESEIAKLRAASRYKAFNDAVYFFSSVVVAVFIFMVHIWTGGSLIPRQVYTTLTLLNILHMSLTKQIPQAVMALSECYVSSNRIQAFLELPENINTLTGPVDENIIRERPTKPVISLEKVSCVWDESTQQSRENNDTTKPKESLDELNKVALRDISLSFEPGKLYCIIGKVGSGKSALMQALANELQATEGSIVREYASIAYVAQSPWIMNGSIRENITMGLSFRKKWYDTIVDACGLSLDFTQFTNGDLTIVGDRGVQCSGGQKSRIGLARAFYRDPQVMLLDDPFSAIDTTVARSIYKLAIQELGLKRGKCIILATHQDLFLNHVDRCILLDKGKVKTFGSIGDVLKSSTTTVNETIIAKQTPNADNLDGKDLPNMEENITPDNISLSSDSLQKEARNTGLIEWSTWAAYGEAAGGWGACAFFALLFTVTQTVMLLTIVQVGIWAEAPSNSQSESEWFRIIIGLTCGLIVLSIARAQMTFHFLIGASKRLHNRMLTSVLRSKIGFFDTNPLGRILNRFSADVGINDETLPLTIYDFLVGFFMVLGGVVTSCVVLPFVLVALPPLVWYFLKLRVTFVTTTRELKRLEGVARSPIFAMMSETLQGVATIRANGCQKYFKGRFQEMHDAHTRAYFSFVAASRWFATRMDILSFILMSTASFLAVLFHDQGWMGVNPAVFGVALTLLLQIATTNFPWIVRQSAEIVNQMVSVERVLEFGDLVCEAPLELDFDKSLYPSWPHNGAVEVRGLSVRYRPSLPLALDGSTFSIPAGCRIGVVGRTGSGKSTLVQTLFRLLEADSGSIIIDGVDISKIGLHRLRSKISVITQMPTLFSGCSIRENLDLFGNYSEEAIVEAIDTAHLTEAISELPNGLDSLVSEGGTNFSVGQIQLLCLARTILCKNKLLVLDEATASVDKHTDQLLHQSLNKAYTNSTIIAIAHRLDTVIDCDLILVLGLGKVLEFGSPAELIRSNGVFSKMVDDSGESISHDLKKRAFATEFPCE